MVVLVLAPGIAGAVPADSLSRTVPAEVRRWQSGALRADRLQHASCSWTIGLGAGIATRQSWAAAAVPSALGLAKEVADRGHSGFDWGDLLADLAGAGAAAWVTSRRF